MIKRFLNKLKKLNRSVKISYLRYCKLPVDDKLVLLEGGQGSNINGNMFSMLREIETNKRWQDYKTVFVVTDNTIESAKSRIEFYGFKNVTLTIRNSDEYCRYLATAKFLMTDNSFPPYFLKRDDQVFFNTWHGTPLKTLGKSDKSNLASLANIQKNYLMSDYALFPNEFTRNVFMKDYDLERIFKGYSLIANYPRNYVFYDKKQSADMKSRLGLSEKIVFAYMPTWRGTGRTADTANQIKSTMNILKEFDEKLDDNTVLLVNLHFLLASEIDCGEFAHIKYFPGEYDTYEVLNACDGLITDYSSVFFDYAVTEKKIILYAYDKEKYLSSRGVYISFDSLPFPIVETVDEVINQMKTPAETDEKFIENYCPNGWVNSCERLFELIVSGKTKSYQLEKQEDAGEKICLIYAGKLPEVHFENIKNYINKNPDYNYVIAYRRNFNKISKEYVLSLHENISTLGIVNAFQPTMKELIPLGIHKVFGIMKNGAVLDAFFSREANRMFYSVKPEKIVDFSCGNFVMAGIISKLTGEKEFIKHGDYYCVSKRFERNEKYVQSYELANSFLKNDMSAEENRAYVSRNEDGFADESFRKNSYMKNIIPFYYRKGNVMKCFSLFSFRTPVKTRLKDCYLTVDEREYTPKFISNASKLSKSHFGFYSFEVPIEDVIDMPSTNMVALCYKNQYDHIVQCHIIYFSLLYRFFLGLRGPIVLEKSTNTVAIFRQSKNNRLNIYVRSSNKSDRFYERLKQFIAYFTAMLWHTKKAKKLVILYEKNSSKYEESASVTFEKLIDCGYSNAYFIVDRDYEYIDRIPDKYKSNIIYKYTFKHYLYFFKAKTFIGTEALVHAIDLKTFNVFALKKISDKNINYVFLQHGVMYMVSLDSESRNMFKRKRLNGKYRVVVSSHAEADHFVELGRHYEQDLYITGLPKFDRNVLLPDADKIVIMPTWRPWEINAARDDFTQTAYFKMVMKIYESVPDKLKDKVVILPHPLIVNELRRLDSSVAEKMVIGARYDDILKQTRVLITDYSSIAYDAFYRGSRVIFYWEEKDYCMEQYGPSTKLMLNEENVYGDYFYNTDGLSEAIEFNYDNPQNEKYISRYSKIVEFHDSKNTERLIELLKEDEII